MFRTRSGIAFVILLAAAIGVTMSGTATPKERSWYKYENSHFEVYSDESQRVVRKLLEELENFRAAVLQAVDIEVPQGAPKPRVIIFASDKEYLDLVDRDRVGGLPVSINGIPHIALASSGNSRLSETALRHRCAHLLLAYKNLPYPKWFGEGFAQVFASTDFRKRNTEFTVGRPMQGSFRSDVSVPWKHIISEDFDPHSLSISHPSGSTLYPSWLLTHYFLLGDNFRNAPSLARYLALLADGQPSVKAFEAIVGEPVDQFGNKLLKVYGRDRTKYMVFPLDSSGLDHQFIRRKAAEDEIQPVLDNFHGHYRND